MADRWRLVAHWSLTRTRARYECVLTKAHNRVNEHGSITLARLISRAGRGQGVTYADGDRTNLRRHNLLIVKGGGIAKAPVPALRPRKDAAPKRDPTVTAETP